MPQFLLARLLETENLAALRIDPGHDVPDGAVLSAGIHPLKNQQQRIPAGRAVQLLQGAQLLNVFFQKLVVIFLGLANGLHSRRPLAEFDFSPGAHPKVLCIDFHPYSFVILAALVTRVYFLVSASSAS